VVSISLVGYGQISGGAVPTLAISIRSLVWATYLGVIASVISVLLV